MTPPHLHHRSVELVSRNERDFPRFTRYMDETTFPRPGSRRSRSSSSPNLSLALPQLSNRIEQPSNANGPQNFTSNPSYASAVEIVSPIFEPSTQRRNHSTDFVYSSNPLLDPESQSAPVPSITPNWLQDNHHGTRLGQARSVQVGEILRVSPPWTQRSPATSNRHGDRGLEVSVREVFQASSRNIPRPGAPTQNRVGINIPVNFHQLRARQVSSSSLSSSVCNQLVESLESHVSLGRVGPYYRNNGCNSSASATPVYEVSFSSSPSSPFSSSSSPFPPPSSPCPPLSNVVPASPVPPVGHDWWPSSFQSQERTSWLSSGLFRIPSSQRSFLSQYETGRTRQMSFTGISSEPKGLALQELRQVSTIRSFEGFSLGDGQSGLRCVVPTHFTTLFRSALCHGRLLRKSRSVNSGRMTKLSHGSDATPAEIEGDSKRTCTICCADFLPGEPIRSITHCGHRYHVYCVDRWFEDNTTCPICRSDLRTKAKIGSNNGETAAENPHSSSVAIIAVAEGVMEQNESRAPYNIAQMTRDTPMENQTPSTGPSEEMIGVTLTQDGHEGMEENDEVSRQMESENTEGSSSNSASMEQRHSPAVEDRLLVGRTERPIENHEIQDGSEIRESVESNTDRAEIGTAELLDRKNFSALQPNTTVRSRSPETESQSRGNTTSRVKSFFKQFSLYNRSGTIQGSSSSSSSSSADHHVRLEDTIEQASQKKTPQIESPELKSAQQSSPRQQPTTQFSTIQRFWRRRLPRPT